ncbi:MAG: PAS domain S-box protein [Deltaproteobacteria bacterium]|nr:PAS domain S-box protein [Deltaproteobacteria bacterium]
MPLKIRNKLLLGFSIMLAPLLLLLSINYYNYGSVFKNIRRAEEIRKGIHHLSQLQLAFDMVIMPANDYLITADAAEKKEFDRLTGEIDSLIATLSAKKEADSGETRMLGEIREGSEGIKKAAQEIFKIKKPIGSRSGAKLMEGMDVLSHRVTTGPLAGLRETVEREQEERHRGVEAAMGRAWAINAAGSLVMIALGVLVTFLYSNLFLMRPMRAIRRRTEEIAKGDLRAKPGLKTGDEFEELSDAINSMASEIDSLHAHLEELVEERTKKMNEALKDAEDSAGRYKTLVEASPDSVSVSSEGKIVFINKAGAFLLGANNPGELVGKEAIDFVHPDYMEIERERTMRIMKGEREPGLLEERIRRMDGKEIYIDGISVLTVYNDKPAILSIARDVTYRKEARDAVRKERDKFITIFDAMEDGVYMVNQDYDIEYVNPALKREFGPVEGRKCYEYLHDRKEVCPFCPNKEVWAGRTVRWEWYSPKSGKTYGITDTPVKNPGGNVSKMEIMRDVTDSKRSGKELKERLEELELFRKTTIKREIRLRELKEKVKALEKKLEEKRTQPPQ